MLYICNLNYKHMTSEKKQELVDLLRTNPVIKTLEGMMGEKHFGFRLVGGAVIDILEGRTPKDYDFLNIPPNSIDLLLENGFVFQHKTKTAATYKRGDVVIQDLFIPIGQFDFVISQATYEIANKRLDIDEISFTQKTLIPISFSGGGQGFAAMSRIPHWQDKGYSIEKLTYLSLLNSLKFSGSGNYTKGS